MPKKYNTIRRHVNKNRHDNFTYEELYEHKKFSNLIRIGSNVNKEYGYREKWTDFCKIMSFLNTQESMPRMQTFINMALGWKEINPREQIGDISVPCEGNYEAKLTVLDKKDDILHFVQIRPWEELNGYKLIVVLEFDEYKTIIFTLTKEDMEHEILDSNMAHSGGNDRAVRFMYGSRKWNEWIGKYRHEDVTLKLKLLDMAQDPYITEHKINLFDESEYTSQKNTQMHHDGLSEQKDKKFRLDTWCG